jgi:hypothetical protein
VHESKEDISRSAGITAVKAVRMMIGKNTNSIIRLSKRISWIQMQEVHHVKELMPPNGIQTG